MSQIPSPVSSEHPDMDSSPILESEPSNVISPAKASVPSSLRQSRSPPRNAANEIICKHPDCANKQPQETFKRPCEYNKHMDRHERPYKCREPGCELSLGFTYSGGLLRHQREVHKMHLSSKHLLFCPFANCNRSNGTGFTRKENLEEHKRRRHLGELTARQSLSLSPPAQSMSPLAPPTFGHRKRKRLPTPPHRTEDEDARDGTAFLTTTNHALSGGEFDVHPTVKSLHNLLAQKDQIIHWQQTEIQKLQHIISCLPQQALYNINAVSIVGLGGGTGDEVGHPVNSANVAKMGGR